jgi:hypothetical protein
MKRPRIRVPGVWLVEPGQDAFTPPAAPEAPPAVVPAFPADPVPEPPPVPALLPLAPPPAPKPAPPPAPDPLAPALAFDAPSPPLPLSPPAPSARSELPHPKHTTSQQTPKVSRLTTPKPTANPRADLPAFPRPCSGTTAARSLTAHQKSANPRRRTRALKSAVSTARSRWRRTSDKRCTRRLR